MAVREHLGGHSIYAKQRALAEAVEIVGVAKAVVARRHKRQVQAAGAVEVAPRMVPNPPAAISGGGGAPVYGEACDEQRQAARECATT